MLFGGLMMGVVWGALIALVFFAARAFLRSAPRREVDRVLPDEAGPTNRSLEILKERYARGEVTREQYDEMRRDLLA